MHRRCICILGRYAYGCIGDAPASSENKSFPADGQKARPKVVAGLDYDCKKFKLTKVGLPIQEAVRPPFIPASAKPPGHSADSIQQKPGTGIGREGEAVSWRSLMMGAGSKGWAEEVGGRV